jgi:hypothetical protein
MNIVKALFIRNFWMSGLAIARYIPRSFTVKQVGGNLFYTEAKREEFQSRVRRITVAAPRQWGTMSVAQMLHYLNLACDSSLGFYQLADKSYFVSRTVFRWILVDWFPEQPVGLRLPADFKILPGQEFDFESEKAQLLVFLEAAWHASNNHAWKPHPMFGKMTDEESGKLLLIHVDYHLKRLAA